LDPAYTWDSPVRNTTAPPRRTYGMPSTVWQRVLWVGAPVEDENEAGVEATVAGNSSGAARRASEAGCAGVVVGGGTAESRRASWSTGTGRLC
jgi:hypothetical protein